MLAVPNMRNIQERDTGKHRLDARFIGSLIVKVLCAVFTGVILVLVKQYHDSYMIAVMIAVSSCTYIYIAVSVIMNFAVVWACKLEQHNCHFLESFASLLLFCGWLLSAGIATEISLRAGSRTTELFAWVGACCGLNTALFALLCMMFGAPVVQSMIRDRNQ